VKILFPSAFALGIALCLTIPQAWNILIPHRVACEVLLCAALALSLHRQARRSVGDLVHFLRQPGAGVRLRLGLIVAIISAIYLYAAAVLNDRPLVPRLLDEKAYTLQARMLAQGRLWRASHPHAEFFETFDVLNTPLTTVIYPPGTAAMYVPGEICGSPDWITSLAIGAAICGLTCLITMELFNGDGMAGITAALLVLATTSMHDLSTWILPHQPVMLCALLMIYAWLQWRSAGPRPWALLMGAAAGLGAITRPSDALVYAIPMAIVIVLDLIHLEPDGRRAGLAVDLTLALLAAAPFLALQGYIDKKVTGHVLVTPSHLYTQLDQPAAGPLGRESRAQPQITLPQKWDYYHSYILPQVKTYRSTGMWQMLWQARLPNILKHALANRLQLLLLPAGCVMVWFDRRLLVIVLPLAFFVLLHLLNPLFNWYDAIVLVPALAMLSIAGAVALAQWLPAGSVVVMLGMLAIAFGSIPEIFGDTGSDQKPGIAQLGVENVLADNVKAPALVFFTYHRLSGDLSSGAFDNEPVYPLESGWPDDESIARAQDLGATKNTELIAYYAGIQPERNVYVIDRDSCAVRSLGTAAKLAGATRSTSAPAPSANAQPSSRAG
jgi:4-amino-4-deoxy-L-arabinose transferase-like glycosyltransferase